MGLIGYEVQKVLAAVDWFAVQAAGPPAKIAAAKIGVIGWGEGGLVALYSAALDPRIGAVCTSGYFDRRSDLWQEPLDRNIFSLLEQFGDAELASLIAPRRLIVEAAKAPEATIPPGGRGGPGRIVTAAAGRGRSRSRPGHGTGRRSGPQRRPDARQKRCRRRRSGRLRPGLGRLSGGARRPRPRHPLRASCPARCERCPTPPSATPGSWPSSIATRERCWPTARSSARHLSGTSWTANR